MKKILLAVLFGLGVPAWANGVVSEAPTAPMDHSDCLRACAEQYDDCVGAATDQESECECFNTQTACLRGCGIRRPFIPCF